MTGSAIWRQWTVGGCALLMALALSACGSGGDSGGGGGTTKKTITTQWTGNTTTFASGRGYVALHVGFSSCSGSPTTGIRHTTDEDITSAGGPVDMTFQLSSGTFPNAYAETYYVDVDNSNTLTNGDIVWGSDPMDFSGACFNTISGRPAFEAVSWDEIAGILGSTTWTGGTQTFGAEEGDESDYGNASFTIIPAESSYAELLAE